MQKMEKAELKKLIDTAAGRIKADVVLKNCKVINVFTSEITEDDIALSGPYIAGIGDYQGEEKVDCGGRYAAPGFIDSHIHIESSYVSPEELGRLLVPHGGTTIIADPHEICNVCGVEGLNYMMRAAKNTVMDIKFMLPSCVPATPFEDAGAVIRAEDMDEPISRDNVLGLGEFMNYPGVIQASDADLKKILQAKNHHKIIDGHSPGVTGKDLTAYIAAGVHDEHECATSSDLTARVRQGMYVMLRQGTICQDLRNLAPGVTLQNSRRILLCSDDRQPKTILTDGHIDYLLQLCVEEGIDAVTAIQMATLNAAECFRLYDRGALAPGYRADIVLLDDLTAFHVNRVWVAGKLVAEEGKYLPTFNKEPITPVASSVHLKDFSKDKFKMHLTSNHVWTVQIQPGGVLTKKVPETIDVKNDEFVFTPTQDIVKMAVIERHKMTGKVGCGFLSGYGIKAGAVALSVAHDSHNIITVGVNDDEMAFAVEALAKQKGGIVLVKEGKVLESMPMPIAGLMSDQSGEWVRDKLDAIYQTARTDLAINGDVDPVMTLCFMSLCVIPEIKLTDRGLFDVNAFKFIPVEVDDK